MAKQEKTTTRNKKPATISRKDSASNSPLTKALAIAVVLHILALILFRIEHHDFDDKRAHSPIVVGADIEHEISIESSLASSQIDKHGMLQQYILEPESTIPFIFDPPAIPIDIHFENIKGLSLPGESFSQVERDIYQPPGVPLSFIKQFNPVTTTISGEITSNILIADGLSKVKKTIEKIGETEKHVITFAVKMENKSGRIFLADLIKASELERLNILARNIISEMLFKSNSDAFITNGEIAITFEINTLDPHQSLLE